jgi:hypothetical protein
MQFVTILVNSNLPDLGTRAFVDQVSVGDRDDSLRMDDELPSGVDLEDIR